MGYPYPTQNEQSPPMPMIKKNHETALFVKSAVHETDKVNQAQGVQQFHIFIHIIFQDILGYYLDIMVYDGIYFINTMTAWWVEPL